MEVKLLLLLAPNFASSSVAESLASVWCIQWPRSLGLVWCIQWPGSLGLVRWTQWLKFILQIKIKWKLKIISVFDHVINKIKVLLYNATMCNQLEHSSVFSLVLIHFYYYCDSSRISIKLCYLTSAMLIF